MKKDEYRPAEPLTRKAPYKASASELLLKRRKRIRCCQNRGGDPSCGTSSEDVLIPTERHPACRQREARSGSGTERENLAGDAKGKGTSGYNREAESTDASERGGLPRSSNEGPVMGLEQRGWVIAADLGQLVRWEEPFVQWKAAAFARWHEPDDARVSSPDL